VVVVGVAGGEVNSAQKAVFQACSESPEELVCWAGVEAADAVEALKSVDELDGAESEATS
jgi:hypothetical protein